MPGPVPGAEENKRMDDEDRASAFIATSNAQSSRAGGVREGEVLT